MVLELRPMGVACNIKCTYCYQQPMRDAGNIHTRYDLDKMIAEVEKVGQKFNLFGGEALLVPKEDLEKLWKYGFEKFGTNGLQTNGTLIDDDHIEMMVKYNVHPGVSIDGPNELNRLRWAGSEDKTDEYTKRTIDNLVKMRKAGLKPGIIITLHRLNGTGNNLDRLLNFIDWLGKIGITGGNVHTLEVEEGMPNKEELELTQEENIEAFVKMAEFFAERPHLRWRPFADVPKLLSGNDRDTTCFWNYCDNGDTNAVYGIEGNGALSNCGRTNKEGIDWYKADRRSYARYVSFYNTPDEMGGCKGCRFWMVCGGSCPGEAQQNDFRNKTIHCKTQKALLGHYENLMEAEGQTPVTKSPIRPMIEQILVENLGRGRRMQIWQAIEIIENSKSEMIVVPVVQDEPKKEVDTNATT